jgi:hypothetical protein
VSDAYQDFVISYPAWILMAPDPSKKFSFPVGVPIQGGGLALAIFSDVQLAEKCEEAVKDEFDNLKLGIFENADALSAFLKSVAAQIHRVIFDPPQLSGFTGIVWPMADVVRMIDAR